MKRIHDWDSFIPSWAELHGHCIGWVKTHIDMSHSLYLTMVFMNKKLGRLHIAELQRQATQKHAAALLGPERFPSFHYRS